MRYTTTIVKALGVVLVVVGSQVWGSRLSFEPDTKIASRFDSQLKEVKADAVNDLTEECNRAKSASGWVVFVLYANLTNDNQFRTYFETAEERIGLWVEYDYGLLRLGLGLGPTNPESNTEVPIRIVRQNERATIVIAVSRNETRVITNNRDVRKNWPAESASSWSCERVQFADNDRDLSEGHECEQCDIRLLYTSGENLDDLSEFMESISNVQRFNLIRGIGSVLTAIGFLLMLGFTGPLVTYFRRDSSLPST